MNNDDLAAETDGDEWSYGDDMEKERTQYGILIDSEAADFFRDMVKLANDGKIREKTGPELETAMKYYTAIFFRMRPYELERVADGQVDYIRNPEAFVKIAKEWSEDVSAELAEAGGAPTQSGSETSPSEPVSLLGNESGKPSSQQHLDDSDEVLTQEKLQEALRIMTEFVDRSADEIPDEIPFNQAETGEDHSVASQQPEQTTGDDTPQQNEQPPESDDNDVLETDP